LEPVVHQNLFPGKFRASRVIQRTPLVHPQEALSTIFGVQQKVILQIMQTWHYLLIRMDDNGVVHELIELISVRVQKLP